MRNKIVATIVALFMTTGFIGCKTAPKMPWSKTAAKSDVESTALLAHSAPSLPADIAKEAEGLASSTPAIEMSAPATEKSGGTATPYSAAPAFSATPPAVAATTPMLGSGAKSPSTAYPSTGASPYSTTASPTIAASTPVPQSMLPSYDKSANLGSVDMPYNPAAVPPAKTVASTAPVTPSKTNDRYGMSSMASTSPAYGGASVPPIKTASVTQSSGGGRYGNIQTSSQQPTRQAAPPAIGNVASTTPVASQETNTAPAYGSPASTAVSTPPASVTGDRYALPQSVAPTLPSGISEGPLNTVAPVVASAPSYRPGGTTSYQGTTTSEPTVELASRPQAVEQQVPNVSVPVSTPEPSQAPRYR